MKITKKILLILIITLTVFTTMCSFSTVYGLTLFREELVNILKLNDGKSHFFPYEAEGGTLFCIQDGGELRYSGALTANEYTYYTTEPGKYTRRACPIDEPPVEIPWEKGSRWYYRYTPGTVFSWSEHPDAAYVLAEMEERGELESWESAAGIKNSSISLVKVTGGYEIEGESQAYDTFYQEIHGGYTTNDIFETVVKDSSGNIKIGVNQNEGSYTVGPFIIDYPDGYYNGKNKFSWIESIEAVTDAGTLPVKILDKAGNEINVEDLKENGTKTLDNVEFYVKFYSTEATQMNLKVEFGYLEHCEATMIEYDGERWEINWYDFCRADDVCRHEYNIYDDEFPDEIIDTKIVDVARRGYVAVNEPIRKSQVLMLAKDISKVRKKATLYFKGAKTEPTVEKQTPTDQKTPETPIDLTMNLAGTVFIDQDTGKVNAGNNKLDSGEGLPGTEVYLHEVGGSVVAKTLTDSSGNYYFYKLNSQKNYYVEFVYNGMLYTNVDRLSGNAIDISKATEEAQGHGGNRQSFNAQFTEIGSFPSNYNGRRVYLQEDIADTFKDIASNFGSHGSDDKSLYAYDCRISAYTTETYPLTKVFTTDTFNNVIAAKNYQALYQSGGQYDQTHVNLGIKSRPTFDLALYKDVFKAVLNINGKEETYTYDARKDWTNQGFSFGVNEDDYLTQLRDKYISGAATNLPTTETIDEGSYDHEYRTEEIVNGNNQNTAINESKLYDESKNYAWRDINSGLTQNDKLQIHVTYKIAIKNQSSVVGAVREVVDYYDSNYQFESAYVGDSSGNQIATVTASESSIYGDGSKTGTWTTTTGQGGYKTIYLQPAEQSLGDGDEQYIYATFGLIDPETTLINAGLPDGNKFYTYNLAEINGYTTYEMGLVDRDSIPGNFDPSSYVMGSTALEDDESKAPAYVYSLRTSRTLEGTVFEDTVTSANSNKINTNQTRFGNGTIENTDKKIQGIKVELVEVKNGQLISRQTTYTDKNGWYGFGSFIPGDYVIRFTYGSDDQTALTTTSQYVQGLNDTSYNGQDYQSTIYTTSQVQTMLTNNYKVDETLSNIYTANNQAKNDDESNVNVSDQTIKKYAMDGYYWYDDSTIANKSDATDDTARRAQVTAYSKTEYGTEITNHKAEVFNSYINQATLREQESNDNNFDEYTQAQPMDASVDTQSKNRQLVNELERRTYMYAYTAEIPVEVEYTVKQITGNQSSDKYTYKITGVDFGVVERAKSQLTIDQDVAHIKVTATDGTTLLELNNNNGKIEVITDNGNNYQWIKISDTTKYDQNELLNVILDDELLSGAKIEITYNITVTNNSEQDGDSTTRAKTIINYVANNLNFDLSDNNGLWEVVKKEDIQTASNGTYINNETGSNNRKLVDLSTQTTVLKATSDNPLTKVLKPGESVTSTLTLKKTLSAESSTDDLSYSNMSEIVEIDNTVGRYDRGAIPGNQSLEEQPREHDTSGASRYDETDQDSGTKNVKTRYPEDGKVIVTPPTGSTHIYYVLGITVAVILAAGVFIIKKFVIGRKK